ncbi:MAG: hypothetical protein KI790_16480 [Cyclobacteriaceae bacterium]|nr:hypothetical protein [Cyclobacteriaceae bacterium HetDA_MAG_MS6]
MNRAMKILKIAAIILLVLSAMVFAMVKIVSEPLPTGEHGEEAEALADKMLAAINYEGFQQLTELRWSFPRRHHFVWNKQENIVNVQWDDYEVNFSPQTMSGTALNNGEPLTSEAKSEAIQKAWSLFANDSFWLCAPFKIRDPGTIRSLVESDRGPALLVTYSSGGVTPGDSYLWLLDADGLPVAWKMWVGIIPIGGMEFSWEGWQEFNGVRFAPLHNGPGPVSIDLRNLEIH